jgi:hypothetical protein
MPSNRQDYSAIPVWRAWTSNQASVQMDIGLCAQRTGWTPGRTAQGADPIARNSFVPAPSFASEKHSPQRLLAHIPAPALWPLANGDLLSPADQVTKWQAILVATRESLFDPARPWLGVSLEGRANPGRKWPGEAVCHSMPAAGISRGDSDEWVARSALLSDRDRNGTTWHDGRTPPL